MIILLVICNSALAGVKEGRKVKRVNADLALLAGALERYKMLAGNFPTTEQGLNALVDKPEVVPRPRRWIQMFRKKPLDPWGREYEYKLHKGKFQLWSLGEDAKDKQDDIPYVPPKVDQPAHDR